MLSDTSNTLAWPSELKIYLIKDQWQDFQCPTNISAARVMLSYDLFNKSGVIAAGHHLRKMATLIFLYKIHSYPDILEKSTNTRNVSCLDIFYDNFLVSVPLKIKIST